MRPDHNAWKNHIIDWKRRIEEYSRIGAFRMLAHIATSPHLDSAIRAEARNALRCCRKRIERCGELERFRALLEES